MEIVVMNHSESQAKPPKKTRKQISAPKAFIIEKGGVTINLEKYVFILLKSKTLCIQDSKLTDTDIKQYVLPFLDAHPEITALELARNKIGSAGACLLATNNNLKWLDLSANSIGDKGAIALAKNKTLRILYVCNNSIRENGASALAANDTLTTLDISKNQIGENGASAFDRNFTLKTLIYRRVGSKAKHSLSQRKMIASILQDLIRDLSSVMIAYKGSSDVMSYVLQAFIESMVLGNTEGLKAFTNAYLLSIKQKQSIQAKQKSSHFFIDVRDVVIKKLSTLLDSKVSLSAKNQLSNGIPFDSLNDDLKREEELLHSDTSLGVTGLPTI